MLELAMLAQGAFKAIEIIREYRATRDRMIAAGQVAHDDASVVTDAELTAAYETDATALKEKTAAALAKWKGVVG